VADIDGDGKPEIIVSLKDTLGSGYGGVQIYDVPGSSDNCVMWGTGRGGLLRQGSYQPRIGASSTPSLTLIPVTTPTNLNSQTISGATEAGATVTVATDSAASDGTATVIGSGWSYAITGLTWGTNNVTVTAMDGAGRKALKNTSITRSPKLDVVFAGSGGGLVTSEPQGIHCPAGECSRLFVFNSPVTLFAYPDTNSLFSGWSACAGLADCAVTMDNDKSVSAQFNYVQPARIPGNPPAYYTLLGDAYLHLSAGGTIQAREFPFEEGLTLNRSLAVTIEGGYDLDYSGRSGFTILKGCLIVQNGSLQVAGVEVR
jgi:hypothetical protein